MTLLVGYGDRNASMRYSPFEEQLSKLEPLLIGDHFYYCGNGKKDYEGVIKTAKQKAALIVRLVTGRDITKDELSDICSRWSIVVEANEEFRKKSCMNPLYVFLKLESDWNW